MIEFFEFQSQPRVLYKAGLVDELGHEVERLGTRAVIVADEGVARAGLLDRVHAGLAYGIEVVGIFSDVPSNSSVANIWQESRLISRRSAVVISSMSFSISAGLPVLAVQAGST